MERRADAGHQVGLRDARAGGHQDLVDAAVGLEQAVGLGRREVRVAETGGAVGLAEPREADHGVGHRLADRQHLDLVFELDLAELGAVEIDHDLAVGCGRPALGDGERVEHRIGLPRRTERGGVRPSDGQAVGAHDLRVALHETVDRLHAVDGADPLDHRPGQPLGRPPEAAVERALGRHDRVGAAVDAGEQRVERVADRGREHRHARQEAHRDDDGHHRREEPALALGDASKGDSPHGGPSLVAGRRCGVVGRAERARHDIGPQPRMAAARCVIDGMGQGAVTRCRWPGARPCGSPAMPGRWRRRCPPPGR